MRKRQLKAVGLRSHLVNFKRNLAGPHEPVEGIRLIPSRTPTTIRPANEQSVVGQLQRQRTGAEARAKGKANALVVSVDFFKKNSHNGAVRLIANKKLAFERTELATSHITRDAARRLPHLLIRKVNRGRFQLQDLPCFDHHAAFALWIRGPRADRSAGDLVPLVTSWVPLKRSRLEMLQTTRAIPGSLIIGIENIADRIHGDAAR